MGNYKIVVNVKIVECNEAEVGNLSKKKNGNFEMTINEEDAISIDKCEKALLATNYEAIRDAISEHLTAVSKKNSATKKTREVDSQHTSIPSRW